MAYSGIPLEKHVPPVDIFTITEIEEQGRQKGMEQQVRNKRMVTATGSSKPLPLSLVQAKSETGKYSFIPWTMLYGSALTNEATRPYRVRLSYG
jgi:hypothetical protein